MKLPPLLSEQPRGVQVFLGIAAVHPEDDPQHRPDCAQSDLVAPGTSEALCFDLPQNADRVQRPRDADVKAQLKQGLEQFLSG